MSDARTAREALLAEILGDVDDLLKRFEALGPQMSAQAERLTAATQSLQTAALANADAAKESVGAYITHQTNEAVAKAKGELRSTMNEAARAAYDEIFAARMHALVARIEAAGQAKPPASTWPKLVAAAAAGAVIAALLTAVLTAALLAR